MESIDVIKNLDAPSSVLAIAFGGMGMRVGGTPYFEFFRMLESTAKTKQIFVRDSHRCWYHRGIVDVAECIDGVREELSRVVADSGVTRVIMLGASAGGYAALLFASLLGVAEVHAFAPQTFISPELRARYRDGRWEDLIASLMESGGYQPAFGDLRPVVERACLGDTRFVIHYCKKHRLDTIHARRLESFSRVELRRHDEGGHAIANHMRETGELQPLLRNLLRDTG